MTKPSGGPNLGSRHRRYGLQENRSLKSRIDTCTNARISCSISLLLSSWAATICNLQSVFGSKLAISLRPIENWKNAELTVIIE